MMPPSNHTENYAIQAKVTKQLNTAVTVNSNSVHT